MKMCPTCDKVHDLIEYRNKRKVYTLNNSKKGYLSPYGGITIKR